MKKVFLSRQKIIDTAFFVLLLWVFAYLFDALILRAAFGVALALSMLEIEAAASVFYKKDSQALKSALPCLVLTCVVLLMAIVVNLAVRLRPEEYLLFFATITGADAGGLLFGSLFGNKKVAALRTVSPNKSYAGYLGELLTAWLCGFLLVWLLAIPWRLAIVLFVLLAPIVGAVGDLIGSFAKRCVGVKDSGEILRHRPFFRHLEVLVRSRNGFLDCFDSLSLAFLFFTTLLFNLT